MCIKTLTLTGFLALIILAASCDRTGYDTGLRELDEQVRDSYAFSSANVSELNSMYQAMSQAWTDSLKWEAAYSLFDYWFHRNTDSTFFYLDRMIEIQWDQELVFRSKVCRAKAASVAETSKLEILLPEITGVPVSESFLDRYSSMMIDIYSRNTSLSSFSSLYPEFLESAIKTACAADTLMWYKGLSALSYNETADALHYLMQAYELTDNLIIKGACAESLADIYSSMGNKELEMKWLIAGAVDQIRGGEGELRALYRLSLILSDYGSFSRAAEYVNLVIERASSEGFPDLVLDSATGSLAITTTLDKIETTRQNVLTGVLGGAMVVLVFVSVLFWRDRRKSHLILRTKEALMMSNRQLEDANKIKDGYLVAYMNLSISYLEKIDDDRRMFRRILKELGLDALNAELRKPSSTIDKYKDFYKTFDNVFLSLYPDFVSRINKCFNPEDTFKENGRLTTPLRILALIRLGIVESGEIARFLNCSPETIYSHRSRLKAKALCDNFENFIKNIGK